MKRAATRIGAVAAGTILAVGLVPGAANAATGAVKDPRGDAPKAADITKLKLKNGTHRVTGTITLAHPRKLKKLASTDLILRTKDSGAYRYVVSIVRDENGVLTNRQLGWVIPDDPATYEPLVCNTITTKWLSKKRFRISVPVSCLTETQGTKVKGKAAILARVGPGHDSYDEVTRYTRYLKRG
ncbi:hypothetical protein FE697_003160 [Mumia zhuanghuii]|uniref:Uncharacterized protein n=2 Tax=Mumia TaxID=1546255 RepID=A0ABW1QM09_9ACTN|nr:MULTISPECIES: hypothetical protein [Mumia]KAA1424918.1 hypothetical protein FE697_003160 [Mumia zhuanghuii]